MIELLRDLLKHNKEAGIAGITRNAKTLFDYVYVQSKQQLVQAEKQSWQVHGKLLEDTTSLVKLQIQMVRASEPYPQFVVPCH